MPPLSRARAGAFLAVAALAWGTVGCTKKASPKECEELRAHFADLVVKERLGDASAETIAEERAKERQGALSVDELKNCTSGVQEAERNCAMAAQSSAAILKCLE